MFKKKVAKKAGVDSVTIHYTELNNDKIYINKIKANIKSDNHTFQEISKKLHLGYWEFNHDLNIYHPDLGTNGKFLDVIYTVEEDSSHDKSTFQIIINLIEEALEILRDAKSKAHLRKHKTITISN